MNTVIQEAMFPKDRKLQLVEGDLTVEPVDAIVNAANNRLQHGGGIAGVIARKGGRKIQEESDAWVMKHGTVSHDRPAYTSGGNLPYRYVIHAVGPVWHSGNEDAKLAAAVKGSLEVAGELNCVSVALPALSTGIFGFPKDRAARVILETAREYLQNQPETSLKQVRVTIIDRSTLDAFQDAWREIFPGS